MKKKHGIILIVVTLIIIGAFFGLKSLINQINALHQELIAEKILDIDLTKIADGTYAGRYDAFPVAAEVKVTVKNHRITGIELVKHRNGRGAPAETIPERVMEAQSLAVDTVAGAIISSKVILKAIENALIGIY